MAFDFAKAKTQARRVVHDTLGVLAYYKDDTMSTPVAIRARHHNKIDMTGDLDGSGYAQTIEGIDRIVFDAQDARTLRVKVGGVVTFTDYGSGMGVDLGAPLGGEGVAPPAYILRVRLPSDGPVNETWEVSRK